MRQLSRTAGRDDRDTNALRHGSGQRQIVAFLRSVSVHTGQQNLSCPHLLCGSRPFHSVHAHVHTTTVFIDIPAAAVCTHFCINGNHNTLTAELLCRIADKPGIHNGSGIHRDFVRTFTQDCLEIIHGTDSSSYGERNKYLTRHLPHPL